MPRARTMLLALLAGCLALFCACSAALLVGCLDDGDGPIEHVDYITFKQQGVFREYIDAPFVAGECAFDVLAENPPRAWMMGPGASYNFVAGTDADLAPYPNPMLPRKATPDGRLDKRFWTAFAGGPWNSIGIQAEPKLKFRASMDPRKVYPRSTVFVWQPTGRGEMWWSSAVLHEEVVCWAYGPTGREKRVSKGSCTWYHPRQHWAVDFCDDCPLPAVRGEEGRVQDQAPDAARRDVIGWGSEVDAGGQGVERRDHLVDVADDGVMAVPDAHPLGRISGLGIQDNRRRLGAHGQLVEVVGDDVAHQTSVALPRTAGQGEAHQ
jgi:hypothetical protein